MNLTIFSRLVKPRATRTALIVASVPELTMRTSSIDGTPHLRSRAVGVPDMGSLGAGDEERLGHADALHRPHRRVDPAGDVLPSLVEEARRGLCLHSTLPGKISLPETFNILRASSGT